MADGSTILNFYNVAQNREFARKFMFRVQSLGPFTEDDLIYVTTTKMPGREIAAKEVKFAGYPLQIPGTVKVDNANWEVQFRCDEAHNIRRRALAWQDEIFSFQKTGNKFGTPSLQSGVFEYLTKDRDKPHGSITLHGIFPTKVGDVEYDIADDGEILTFPVTFAYQFWTDSNALSTYTGLT